MKNRRPLLIVVLVLILFCGFVVLITCKSELAKAKDELRLAASFEQAENIWKMHPKIQKRIEWQYEVEDKIASLKPSQSQVSNLENWYPVRHHLNVTIVPDLSNR